MELVFFFLIIWSIYESLQSVLIYGAATSDVAFELRFHYRTNISLVYIDRGNRDKDIYVRHDLNQPQMKQTQ